MAEVKFACPTCGQNIVVESGASGTQAVCPNCQSALIIPSEAPSVPPIPPAPPQQKTSGLAIASLVCPLFLCLGCIPGIICGHLAKRRIRRDPSLKGMGLANAGLLISYLSLVVGAGMLALWTYRVVSGVKSAMRDFNPTVMVQTGTNVSVGVQPAGEETEPAQTPEHTDSSPALKTAGTGGEGLKPSNTAWTLELSQAGFPDQPVSGRFRGANFVGDTFKYRNGSLTIASTDGSSYVLNLGLKRNDPLGGTSFTVLASDTTPACRLTLNWREDGNPTLQHVLKGYALKLQFGSPERNQVPGKIYLCVPDAQRSCLAGSFTVEARK